MVLPTLCAAPAGRRRDRAVRPLFVQSPRCRTRHGICDRNASRRVLPGRAGVRTHAGSLRRLCSEVLALHHRRGAAAPLLDPHSRPHETVETLTDGSPVPGALGAIH